MSTKLNKLVLLSALMIAIIGTFGTVSAEETVDLIAGNGSGQGIDVGNVTVTNNATHIVVEFTTTEDWCMTETHLHIAPQGDVETPAEGIPQTKKGNPIPGKFDYSTDSTDHDCTNQVEYTFAMPLPNGCDLGDDVVIAAHAAVQEPILVDGEPVLDEFLNPTFRYETAWGNGEDFEGKNWATYFTYTIEEPEPEEEVPEEEVPEEEVPEEEVPEPAT